MCEGWVGEREEEAWGLSEEGEEGEEGESDERVREQALEQRRGPAAVTKECFRVKALERGAETKH